MTILIGISSCLLGEEVRFDKGHKKDNFICHLLSNYFKFISVCPEVGAGLGTPRPSMRLTGSPDNPKLIEVKNPDRDHTKALMTYSQQAVKELPAISGYILKNKSPSCGLKSVKIYQEKGAPKQGQGLFAKLLEETYPTLPIEEEGRLNDAKLRENFIERVFLYHRLKTLFMTNLTKQALVDFHTQHKLTLRAHDEKTYKLLGNKMANFKGQSLKNFAKEYETLLMEGMKKIATTKKHANVLMHCMGYFKKNLSASDKQELLDAIHEYRLERLPLIVPITLIKHHLKNHPCEYLENQYYLNPYPRELMLRNHI